MGLILLAPLALGLGALLALPVIAHMSRQVPRERQPFGAMLLVRRLVKRLKRRRRLKDPLLLLLRLLALAAAVFAVAGARWSYEGAMPEHGGSGHIVVVIDTSMSMGLADQGATLLERARRAAIQEVRGLPEGVLVGAVAYDTEARRLVGSLTADHERVVAKLETLDGASGSSNLRAALLEARTLLGGEPGEVFLFTDEAGPAMVAGATSELARLVENESAVVPRPVHANPPRNVAVTSATYGSGLEGGQVVLRVRSYGPLPREVSCEVELPDGQQVPIFVDLPPEGEAEERITVPREADGGVGRVRCDDPDLSADDSRWFHLPQVGPSRVLVVDGDPGDTPTRSEVYFLERALAPWGGIRSGVRPEVTTPAGLATLDPDTHRVVFLANVGDLALYGPRLTEFVRRGGNLVVGVGDNVTPNRYNDALGSVLPAPFRRVSALADPGEAGVPLALPDTSLDLFAPFERSGRAGFSRVRASQVMTLEPYVDDDDVTTLLRWEGGVPALVERRVGKGRVLVWTTAFDFGWSNLPLQAVFMPFVQRLVTYLGGQSGSTAARFDAVAGETVVIPMPDIAMEPEVVRADGAPVTSRIEGGSLRFVPDEPGAYAVRLEGAPPIAWVAVNVDPIESDVRRYQTVAAAERELVPELFTRHVELGPWLWAFGLGALVLQMLLAMRGVQA